MRNENEFKKKIEQIYCHSKSETVEKVAPFACRWSDLWINILFTIAFYRWKTELVHKRKEPDWKQNNAKNGEQNERYGYIKHLKIYRMDYAHCMCSLLLILWQKLCMSCVWVCAKSEGTCAFIASIVSYMNRHRYTFDNQVKRLFFGHKNRYGHFYWDKMRFARIRSIYAVFISITPTESIHSPMRSLN